VVVVPEAATLGTLIRAIGNTSLVKLLRETTNQNILGNKR
jgi:hypothetical protein